MGFNFSPSQIKALEAEGSNVIVSAGAGSGKTQVLSQKVMELLRSGKVKPEELLVLTFTEAAASEMKVRIKKRLKEQNVNQEIIDKVESSHIQTFDSFFMYIVKTYHSDLNLADKVSIIDDSIYNLKLNEFCKEIVEEKSKNDNKYLLELYKIFCKKNVEDINSIIISLYNKIDQRIDKYDILNNYNNTYAKSNIRELYSIFEERTKNELKDFLYNYQFNCPKNNDIYKGMIEAANYNKNKNSYDLFSGLVNVEHMVFNRKPSSQCRKCDNYAQCRLFNERFKYIKNYIEDLNLDTIDLDKKEKQFEDDKNIISYLISILIELDKKINDYKFLTNTYRFSDIATKALEILEYHSRAVEIKNQFKFILIDEYQDTSDIQEKFVKLIENNNVFMVGDIKQSIYLFRYANCKIFNDKYNNYKLGNGGQAIDLNDNFRSRKAILDDINNIFSKTMSEEIGNANYVKDHYINYGLKLYDNNIYDENLYGIHILKCKEKNKDNKKAEENDEIYYIANKIKQLMDQKIQIFDKDENKLRQIKYKDIAILIPKTVNFKKYEKIFARFNIPLNNLIKKSFNEYESLLTLESLIRGVKYFRTIKEDKALDPNNNLLKFIYASYIRSYAYYSNNNFDDEIYENINNGLFIENELFKSLKDIAKSSYEKSIEQTLVDIIDKFNIIDNLIYLEKYKVKDNLNKVDELIKKARSFDDSSLSFDEFANFFEDLNTYGEDLVFEENNNFVEDSVNLLTVHRSKGLEYPVVFLAGNNAREKSDADQIKFSKESGILFKDLRFDNNWNNALANFLLKESKKKDEISEKMRLFYVAVTRAREILYFVTKEEDYNKTDNKKSLTENAKPLNIMLNAIKDYQVNIKDSENIYDYHLDYLELNINKVKSIDKQFNCKTLDYKFSNITKKASMSIDDSILKNDIQDILDFGTKVHEYLEVLDFNNPNFNIIEENFIRNKIKDIFNLDIIKKSKNGRVFKEYEFFDSENNINGIIDLMVVYDDCIDIIDYKLKNISKDGYKDQLNTYRKAISKIFNQNNIKMYLLSIIDGVYEEVKINE